ncbi:UNVERIFIED_CONTAM: hypothetical protein GTU68_056236 [Idotea baltica]|nr:hypothetical protein [Idotea baltica]
MKRPWPHKLRRSKATIPSSATTPSSIPIKPEVAMFPRSSKFGCAPSARADSITSPNALQNLPRSPTAIS